MRSWSKNAATKISKVCGKPNKLNTRIGKAISSFQASLKSMIKLMSEALTTFGVRAQ
jgi:hypothetical protein